MLAVTFLFSDSVQEKQALQNAQKTMTIQTEDAKITYTYLLSDYNDLQDIVREQTLITAHAAAEFVEYMGGYDEVTDELLIKLSEIYQVAEIDLVNKDGVTVRATNKTNLLSVGMISKYYYETLDKLMKNHLAVLNSWSFRIGQSITLPGRKLKTKMKNIRRKK